MATWDESELEESFSTSSSGSISPTTSFQEQQQSFITQPIMTYSTTPHVTEPTGGYQNLSLNDAIKLWQKSIGITPDGVFGPATNTATKNWQSANNITPDGIVGPLTWASVLGQQENYPVTIRQTYFPSASIPITPPTEPIKPKLLSMGNWPIWGGIVLIIGAVYQFINQRDSHYIRNR